MNEHDSEHIAGVLASAGYTPCGEAEAADILIFNTCCVRQGAEDRVWSNLAAIGAKDGSARVVAVCGCMARKHGVEVLRRTGAVRLVFGPESVERLPGLIETCLAKRTSDLGDIEDDRIDRLPALRRSASAAWVPVSHGCDNDCAYCVVPSVRGRQRSRPFREILAEVTGLARDGVIEVTLLGQNVNTYGSDIEGEAGFARLLGCVADVPGIRRVKFETSHPGDMGDDILQAMASHPALCEYLHLPVQSGSDRVLDAMGRGYGKEFIIELAARARQLVPGVTLSTDLIVGFPGETESDFEQTLEVLRTVEFDSAYTFIYSPREGTAAYGIPDDVPAERKKERLTRLVRLQNEITRAALGKVVGSDVEVLVEGPGRKPDQVIGRTRGHQVVVLAGGGIPPGTLVRAAVTGSGAHSVRATVREVLYRREVS